MKVIRRKFLCLFGITVAARNESASTTARALVVHSRAAKDKPLIVVVKK